MNDVISTDNQIIPLEAETKPAIYSKRVIYVFSVLFSAIFGGVLLMKNLRSIGEKKVANLILLGSIAYTILIIIIGNSINGNKSSFGILSCLVGGAILSEYFFKKYFPDADSYEKKPFWIPLIIGIAIVAFIVLCTIYAGPDQ